MMDNTAFLTHLNSAFSARLQGLFFFKMSFQFSDRSQKAVLLTSLSMDSMSFY